MLREFREFALKGNVVDLAVGIVIGAAFTKIVTAFVNDIVMPIVGMFLPSGEWRAVGVTLREAGPAGPEGDARLLLGDLAGVILDFAIVAFVLFLTVKGINRLRRQTPPASPTTRACPYCREEIPLAATRCRACTSDLATVA